MGRWTKPRLIAYKNQWFDDSFDYTGPACYELGTGGPRGGNIQWHYVGETNNESQRIRKYAEDGSHLSKIIDWHLRQGWHLYYRSRACTTKKEAKQMQDNLLAGYRYDWNDKLNKE
jgi:hypothetical protein